MNTAVFDNRAESLLSELGSARYKVFSLACYKANVTGTPWLAERRRGEIQAIGHGP